ncbi:hypothetical protein BJ742DRAFT_857899 [Cladochytrium replicatum]|nr:hypothetical protein BJ742DRAFT_857899 [Cladochytrium replicatum]
MPEKTAFRVLLDELPSAVYPANAPVALRAAAHIKGLFPQITAQVHALSITNASAGSVVIPMRLTEDAKVVVSGDHGCTNVAFAPASVSPTPPPSIHKVSAQMHIASNPALTGMLSFDSLTDARSIHSAANNEALQPSFPMLTHAGSVLLSHLDSISMPSLRTVDSDLAITYTQLTQLLPPVTRILRPSHDPREP